MAALRYVDPHRRGVFSRVVGRVAATRLMTRLARTRLWGATVWRLDRVLLRVTGGRLSCGLALPTALLETRGARTGQLRRNAVIYFHDGERVTIVASRAGHPGNPGWFHNLCANADVRLGGQPFRAEVVSGEAERARLWDLADRVLPAFARYREAAAKEGREIPIVRLTAV